MKNECQTCGKTGGKVVSFDDVPGPGFKEARWVCPWCIDALKKAAAVSWKEMEARFPERCQRCRNFVIYHPDQKACTPVDTMSGLRYLDDLVYRRTHLPPPSVSAVPVASSDARAPGDMGAPLAAPRCTCPTKRFVHLGEGVAHRDDCPAKLKEELLSCPKCKGRHVDRGEWATAAKAHHKHLCEHCGNVWDNGRISVGVEAPNDPQPAPPLTREDVESALRNGVESAKELDAKLRPVFTLPEHQRRLDSAQPAPSRVTPEAFERLEKLNAAAIEGRARAERELAVLQPAPVCPDCGNTGFVTLRNVKPPGQVPCPYGCKPTGGGQ